MVALTSLTPTDGAVEVLGDAPVVAHLEDAAGAIDVALITVTVSGVACTVANGRLAYWGHRRIVGGALVDDWSSVWCATTAAWYDISGAAVDIVVEYDGTALDTVTVRAAALDATTSARGRYETWATAPDWQAGRAGGWYAVVDYYTAAAEKICYYYVQPPTDVTADGWYLVGHHIISDGPAASVVGARHITDGAAAAVVRGWTTTDGPADGLVQAWLRLDGPAAGLPATVTTADGAAAAIVGTLTASDGSAAALVYGVSRRTHVEVRSVSADTAAILAALGVTRA